MSQVWECFEKTGLKVFAFTVDHSPIKPTFGYRIEYKGNILAITGDTIKTENLVKHCQEADLLFSEAISYKVLNNIVLGAKKLNFELYAKILIDILNYHMNPVTAGELAKEANVKKLILVHITPYLTIENAEKMYLNGVRDVFAGEIILGKDNMKFHLEPK